MAKPKKSKTEEYLEEYTPLMRLYGELSHTINFVLETLLKESTISKYLLAPARAKSIESLRGKLIRIEKNDEKDEQIKKLSDVKDLAGCRIRDDMAADSNRFKSYIYENFEVLNEKLHYLS